MHIAKALILAAQDRDDRPWPTANGTPKHLLPVANRPILFHNLEALRTAGVREAAILSGPEGRDAIEDAVGDGGRWGMEIRHATWDPAIGLGRVLDAEVAFVSDEPVLVQQGDALLREQLGAHFATFARERLDALALRLARGTSRVAARSLAPGYVLSPRAVGILREGRSDNPVAEVRAHGGRVRVQRVDGCLPCHGSHDELLESNRCMLERLEPSLSDGVCHDCTVQGAVEVHPTAEVRRSLLRGPLIIGPHARITDAYIGPYTSVGAGVVIDGAEIEHSIVLPEAELRFTGSRMESCVIGRGARVFRAFSLPGATRMSIGDGAEVVLT
jgi:glucose-1-phosphate thymidylyltransferase